MKSMVLSTETKTNNKEYKYIKSKRFFTYFIKRYGLISLFISLILCGMVIGASCVGITQDDIIKRIINTIVQHIVVNQDTVIIGVFADSFTLSFVFAASMILMSMSPFGIITIPAIMFARGVYCGVVSGYLCVTYGLKGLAYYICVMLIGTFVSSLALVYISQYCMDFSASVFREIFYKNNYDIEPLRNKLGIMILNTSYMLILIGFSSLADTVLSFLIGGLFSF